MNHVTLPSELLGQFDLVVVGERGVGDDDNGYM